MFSFKSKSAIGKNSNNNIVIQNSSVTNFVTNSPAETVGLMAKYEAYEDIQQYLQSVMTMISVEISQILVRIRQPLVCLVLQKSIDSQRENLIILTLRKSPMNMPQLTAVAVAAEVHSNW